MLAKMSKKNLNLTDRNFIICRLFPKLKCAINPDAHQQMNG